MTDRRKRILVIDDSAEYLSFMEALLSAEGFCIDIAQSAGEIRERLAAARPDLVISDVRMPLLPAFGVLDLLAVEEKTRTIPVLFCTGATQEVEQEADRLKHSGADVLFKPFDIDDLLGRITRLLDGAPGE